LKKSLINEELIMALFGSNAKEEEIIIAPKEVEKKVPKKLGATTIITAGSLFEGNIKGDDGVHIDGHIKGDIIVDNIIIVGKNGVVDGDIVAHNVVISGKVSGNLTCVDLEVMRDAIIVSRDISVDKVIIDGHVEGSIVSKHSINITNNGRVKSDKVLTQTTTIDGVLLSNDITTKFLEITIKGHLEGNLIVETVKIHRGGIFVGNVSELILDEKQHIKVPKVVNEDQILTEDNYDDEVEEPQIDIKIKKVPTDEALSSSRRKRRTRGRSSRSNKNR
jgi:cytoskeletal protein CcmA (bactofilin family)